MRATTTGNEVNQVVVDRKQATFAINAQVVKLVDTPASGAGDLTVVEVRVFSWAPIQKTEPSARFFIACDLALYDATNQAGTPQARPDRA